MTESRKFGALWLKQGTRGEFMSGELTINDKKIAIVCFKNEKQNDKQPDWDILVAEDKSKGIQV
jgi:hypothetical protein